MSFAIIHFIHFLSSTPTDKFTSLMKGRLHSVFCPLWSSLSIGHRKPREKGAGHTNQSQSRKAGVHDETRLTPGRNQRKPDGERRSEAEHHGKRGGGRAAVVTGLFLFLLRHISLRKCHLHILSMLSSITLCQTSLAESLSHVFREKMSNFVAILSLNPFHAFPVCICKTQYFCKLSDVTSWHSSRIHDELTQWIMLSLPICRLFHVCSWVPLVTLYGTKVSNGF